MNDAARPMPPLARRIGNRIGYEARDRLDGVAAWMVNARDAWPCTTRKYLMVGAESSGTSAMADLLFVGVRGLRFFREGARRAWVWEAYQAIYQGQASIQDYPRLQLFDAIKVPGFATIIPQFREGFPNTAVVYVVRDPRDFVASSIRTWQGQGVHDLAEIPWVKEDWLQLPATDPIERLCLRWKTYLHAAVAAGDVSFVRYEDFYADKVGVMRELARQLEIPFDSKRVDARKDEQIARARRYQPRGPGTWKQELSPPDLATIERVCASELADWHYES